jgi:hypothetical protein
MWQHRAGRVEISFLNDSISGATLNLSRVQIYG